MKAFLPFALLVATSAFSQTPMSNCTEIASAEDRLACFDKLYPPKQATPGTSKIAEPTSQQTGSGASTVQKRSLLSYLTVRDEGLPNSLPVAGPAFVSLVKNGAKETTVAKVSAIFTGPALTTGGSGTAPFASLSLNRDLSGSVAKDSVGGRAGLRTTVFDYTETGFAVDATASFSVKRDRVKQISTQGALIDGRLVHKNLAAGVPFGETGFPFQLVPRVAVGIDRISSAPTETALGQNNFGLIGASIVAWPSFVPRLELAGRYQYVRDFSATQGLAERRLRYYEYGLNFYLFDPSNDKEPFQPIISLLHEAGDDPLLGTTGLRRTTLGLKFKVN